MLFIFTGNVRSITNITRSTAKVIINLNCRSEFVKLTFQALALDQSMLLYLCLAMSSRILFVAIMYGGQSSEWDNSVLSLIRVEYKEPYKETLQF